MESGGRTGEKNISLGCEREFRRALAREACSVVSKGTEGTAWFAGFRGLASTRLQKPIAGRQRALPRAGAGRGQGGSSAGRLGGRWLGMPEN